MNNDGSNTIEKWPVPQKRVTGGMLSRFAHCCPHPSQERVRAWGDPDLLTHPSKSMGCTKLQVAFNMDLTEDRVPMPNFLINKSAILDKLLCSEHLEIGKVDSIHFIVMT